ncbi:MAG: signal recognition particle-docking protein FtsY [Rickettsiales bacterium]|jgi:fused signal recognition particle receptor|nr:signal recognition particle-docking protein FtsY [Rickettsiales bacterium]
MNFLARLKSGLSKTSGKLTDGVVGIFTRRKLDDLSLEQLEELLIETDMGAKLAGELCAKLAKERFEKDTSPEQVREFLAGEIAAILEPVTKPLVIDQSPSIMLVVGVNGNGKTTTIGKLALKFKQEGKKVMLAAADTFRAAAVEQLVEWSRRADVPIITAEANADPASVAYRACVSAKEQGIDVLMIDTAGRLHNKSNLMQELQKIVNVIRKADAGAPHHVIQVLDATTGQNAISQVQTFREMVGVSGLVITKLDGTAKGGMVVALARQFGLPIHALGVGEAIDDLNSFQPTDFAKDMVGLSDDDA